MNSKQKGARGERELSNKLKEYGFNTRRGQQYCGANGDADVVGLDGIHIECKRVESLNINKAMEQASCDAMDDTFDYEHAEYANLPTVFHRKNNAPWLVTMCLGDWMKLYKAYKPNGDNQTTTPIPVASPKFDLEQSEWH